MSVTSNQITTVSVIVSVIVRVIVSVSVTQEWPGSCGMLMDERSNCNSSTVQTHVHTTEILMRPKERIISDRVFVRRMTTIYIYAN